MESLSDSFIENQLHELIFIMRECDKSIISAKGNTKNVNSKDLMIKNIMGLKTKLSQLNREQLSLLWTDDDIQTTSIFKMFMNLLEVPLKKIQRPTITKQ